MRRVQKAKAPATPPKRRWKFRHVGRDAAALGVTREHLRWCLLGKRTSKRLMARYALLKEQQKHHPEKSPA